VILTWSRRKISIWNIHHFTCLVFIPCIPSHWWACM